MDTTAIDVITADFYKTISFRNQPEHDATEIRAFFYGDGLMIDNGFKEPVVYTPESYMENIEALIANEDIENMMRREISAKTEIFGKIAHRTSIYEYSFDDHAIPNPTKGVNYIQFILVEDTWRITSMVWADENEQHLVGQDDFDVMG